MTKVCGKCKVEKPLDEFHLRKGVKDGRRWSCKVCHTAANLLYDNDHRDRKAEVSRIWYSKNKEYAAAIGKAYRLKHPEVANAARDRYDAKKHRVIDFLIKKYGGIPCMDCNGVFAWCVMDFDHRPGEGKEFGIGSKGRLKATPERLAQVQKEIDKCDLVCSNCHRVRTKDRKNND